MFLATARHLLTLSMLPPLSFLDSKDATSLEYKLDSFSSVYRRLTGKEVHFEFPAVEASA